MVIRKKFQLVGVTAMLLSCKYEDVYREMLDKKVNLDEFTYVLLMVKTLKRDIPSYQFITKTSNAEKYKKDSISFLIGDLKVVVTDNIDMETERTIAEKIPGYTEPYTEKLLPNLHPMKKHVFFPCPRFPRHITALFLDARKGLVNYQKTWSLCLLEHPAQFYEIVVYSDYSYMYVDPVMERLDTKHCVRYKLGKDATMHQIVALDTAMSTPVFVQGSLNSVCNRYELLMWEVVYTADEDLESINDTQTELQSMEVENLTEV